MMYRKNPIQKSSIKVNLSYDGESIEKKIQRIVNNREPVTDGAPIIYTERKDGVQAAYDIRTDRFEVALDAMDYVTRAEKAKREERIKERENLGKEATEGMKKEGQKSDPPAAAN